VDLAGTGPYILGGNLDRRIVEVGTAINSWYGWEAIGGRGGAFGVGAGRALGGGSRRSGSYRAPLENNQLKDGELPVGCSCGGPSCTLGMQVAGSTICLTGSGGNRPRFRERDPGRLAAQSDGIFLSL